MPHLDAPARARTFARFAVAAFFASGLAQAAAPVASSPWCGTRCDDIVIDWNATAHQVIQGGDGYVNPLPASRALAMTHLAMHDAVNAIRPRYATYALRDRAPGEADAALAAAVAAHDVLAALYPSQQPQLAVALAKTKLDAGTGPAAKLGAEIGARAAQAVLAKRAQDGSAAEVAYREGTKAGAYRFVPGTKAIVSAQWATLQPFALRSPAQFRVSAPPALDSREYAEAFAEVKATGAATGAKRTEDQTRYAAFWYEFSDAGWNRIARVVAKQRDQDLWQRARLFALLNVAMADAYIAGWDSKLHHDFWRPVSAIRLAADDGNPATAPDASWSSFLPTPPIQDHPSTHSALGAAAATVLAHGYGRDDVRFMFASPTALPEQTSRTFASFSAAAEENADSRVRAGLHFRFATVAGLRLGRDVGRYAVTALLQPID